jgi:heat shock protein HslJ
VPGSVRAGLTIAFTDATTLNGFAGCNTFTAEYTTDGDRITIRAIVATRRLCDDNLMTIEAAYFDALGRVNRWATRQDPDRGRLLLLTRANDRLRLRYTVGITPL